MYILYIIYTDNIIIECAHNYSMYTIIIIIIHNIASSYIILFKTTFMTL